jgi:hypothetical protein
MKRIQFALLVGLLIALTGLLGFKGLINEANAQVVNVQINFQSQITPVPAGYLSDFGEPYALRTGANQGGGTLTYGWVAAGSTTPCNAITEGRLRNTPAAQTVLLRSFVHMEYQVMCNPTEGNAWEMAVPNGFYNVEVSVGDSEFFNSVHRINVEGLNIINFVPPAANIFAIQNAVVQVIDGRLTIDSVGGTNTKINYVHIVSGAAPSSPQVLATNVANGATGVSIGTAITTSDNIYFPDPNAKVQGTTVSDTTVFLYQTSLGQVAGHVPSSVIVSGDSVAITLTPLALLQPFTNYTFSITNGVQDQNGTPFLPYTITFTTGSTGAVTIGPAGVSFTKVPTSVASRGYTSVAILGNRLYATSFTGGIYHWDIDPATGNLSNEYEIGNYLFNRTVIGITFDPASTPANPIMWVTHDEFEIGDMANNFTGGVARLVGSNVGTGGENWVVQEKVYGLPRSSKDHMTNSITFGPDGALYLTQGGVSAMGAPDFSWGHEPETLLSAAILRINPAVLPAGVYNVATGSATVPSNPNSTDILVNCSFGSFSTPPCNNSALYYNPQAPGAAVTIYASGVRNAYDLVWHSNGQLYSATNGSQGQGGTPGQPNAAVPSTPATLPNSCNFRIDAGVNGAYTGPQIPPIIAPLPTQPDYLYHIIQNKYYGHPNPTRCEWVLNGGNPTNGTDPGQTGDHYPIGVLPDRNWRIGFNLGLGRSANGMIEYKNGTAFGGALQGKILTTFFASGASISVSTIGGPTNDVVLVETGAPGMTGFLGPLDLTERVSTGQLYVVEFDRYAVPYPTAVITRLDPVIPPSGQPNIVVTPTN